ncbi:MAG: acyltransferase [Pseudobutyrivibrio sp.]|nr:acyltransferase [Pseudobutyrivibrio sp.]
MLQSKNNSIQGLRFLAITLIIASHCGLLSQGGVGNDIFFAMSGFFVCQPYKTSDYEYEYFNIKRFFGYYKNRIIRILPVCWLCMFFAAFGLRLLDFRDFTTENSLLLNMFFIKSKMHLWFLQQEIAFYVCAPFLILIIGLVKKGLNKIIPKKAWLNLGLFALINLAVFFTYNLSAFSSFRLYGNGTEQLFRIWLFLIGMSFAYLLKAIRECNVTSTINNLGVTLGTGFAFLFFAFSILSGEEIISLFNPALKGYHIGWEHSLLVTYLAGIILVILSLLSDSNIAKKFLGNKLFLSIGNVSFSMYLIHGFLLNDFLYLTNYRAFVVVYLISLCMAIVIYNYIEQPIINAALHRSTKENN